MASTNEESESPLLALQGNFSDTRKAAVKYVNMNKRFYNNVFLAFAVASYVTVFGLPVYSTYVSWMIFGEKHRYVDNKYVNLCGENMMGPKINVGSRSDPVLVNYNTTTIGRPMYAWCGFLPASYFVAWPSVVQTAIFTIYMNTGSTVKLAWQCIAGTFSAILNIYFLNLLFPEGAAGAHYNEWVAWVDLVFVLFLYLASRADENTMKMGMNWTVCLMMHFMNPETGSTLGSYKSFIPYVNWDGETTVVMLTSIAGCLLSILATLFPMLLLNIRSVHDDANEVTNALEDIFEESIGYWAGKDLGPKRFQIFAKMNALTSATKRVNQNLVDSYWETFNLCTYGRVRKLYESFNTAIQNNSDEIYMVKAALETIDFNAHHNNFVEKLKEPLLKLKEATIDCLRKCAQCCKDGHISQQEKGEILQMVENMDRRQQNVSNAYLVAKNNLPYLSVDLAADSLFVFSVAQWAKELGDFGRNLAGFEDSWKEEKFANPCVGLLQTAVSQTMYIFDPRAMFAREQLRFTIMNGIPILATYAMAMYMNESVFTRYSSTMPGVLTLLVSYDYGSTFFNNSQRLMGVVFGQTLPLLVMSPIAVLPCDSWVRFFIHLTSLFAFYFAFTFMYYSSDQWATIGCCIAGFGIYPMFHQCDKSFGVIDYNAQYKSIAQVIIAILLKMLIAGIMAPEEPRDNALVSLDKLITAIKQAYRVFFKYGEVEDEKGLKAYRDDVKQCLAECEAILPKCDPTLQLVPGSRTRFKFELFGAAIGQFKLVLSDLDMMVLAMTGHEEATNTLDNTNTVSAREKVEEAQQRVKRENQEGALFKLMSDQPAWKNMEQDMTFTIDSSLDMLAKVLAHDTEEPIEDETVDKLKSMERVMELAGVPEFYKQVSEAQQREQKKDAKKDAATFGDSRTVTQLKRARLTVAINACKLSVQHMGVIAAECFSHMIYY